MREIGETLIIQPELGELPRLQAWVSQIGKRFALDASTMYALELCCEEAVSNVIRHGLAGAESASETIELKIWRSNDLLHFCLKDHGVPFDPSALPDLSAPASLEEAKIGGLGIHLLHKFSHALQYARREDRNILTLDFLLSADNARP